LILAYDCDHESVGKIIEGGSARRRF
jgi:hypothetical protein